MVSLWFRPESEISESWQAALVIEQQVEFNCTFAGAELSPVIK